MSEVDLKKRLEMAEDELTFLKAVFEEYKDSSGELEAELDAQLKDLERSNLALKRENEQTRAQLQATVMRSRKSAEEASSLTTALEAHLEELTKREKKAQSRIRMLEQENEQLKIELEQVSQNPPEAAAAKPVAVNVVNSEEFTALRREFEGLKRERSMKRMTVASLKTAVYDARLAMAKLAQLTQARFSTTEVDRGVPSLPPEEVDEIDAIHFDVKEISSLIDSTYTVMKETAMATSMLSQVKNMLDNPVEARNIRLDGQTEQAINLSFLTILGRMMLLGENLPEFKRSVTQLKTSLNDYFTNPADPSRLAHGILVLAQDIMASVFDPMREIGRDKELKSMKEETLQKIEEARREGERRAQMEAEARIAREKAEANKATQEELNRIRTETQQQLQSARTEARQMAETARRQALEEAAIERKALEEEIYQSVAKEMDALREALDKSEAQYQQAAMKQQMYQNSMKHAIADQSKAMLKAMANARQELDILRRNTQSELAETQKLMNHSLDHVRKVARTMAKTDIAQLSMMYERELDLRVKLQDQVQALKGNIRVFCRVRPLLGFEIEQGESEAIQQTNEMTVTAEDPDEPGKPQHFMFDRVFGPEDTQEVVFDEMRQLCLSALDGFNVCLFAYGITGSGKTFTVEGGERARENPKLHGLVYRTLKELFRIGYGERAGAYDTDIQVQLLELYNEDFRDLLQTNPNAPRPEVRIIPDLGVIVDNVIKVPVTKLAECLEIVKTGYRARTTKSTDMNSVSSRSHSVLTVHLTGTNIKTKKTYAGKLHFVDLAGSERVGKSGVTGDALKEAQAINKSLSALGDVIQALSAKEKFVPYRNSQLTKLLQESLGGNSKTVMICNIAPPKHSMTETIACLRFATRVHKVEMGKATAAEVVTNTTEVKSIKNKMADLESKFKTGKKEVGGAAPASAAKSAPAAAAPGELAPPTTPRRSASPAPAAANRMSVNAKPPPKK